MTERGKRMEYMGTSEAEKKWGLSKAYISKLCREGIIPAEQDGQGKPWRIPVNTENPGKKRSKK